MRFALKFPSPLLMLSLALAMPATGAWANADHASAPSALHSPRHGPRPGACHVHGGASLPDSSPADSSSPRSPVSYKCCLAGHVVAVVCASDASQPSTQGTRTPHEVEATRRVPFLSRVEALVVVFADPPGTTPLRI
jgi:hypothetical protein